MINRFHMNSLKMRNQFYGVRYRVKEKARNILESLIIKGSSLDESKGDVRFAASKNFPNLP